MLLALDL